jgi:GTPase SAR1 family protein
MFIETVNTISTGVSLVEISQGLFSTVKKFVKRLKKGESRIAIVGAGGTGKTTLGKLFSGTPQIELPLSYQESYGIEEYKMDGSIEASLIVVPGQERQEYRWDELLRTLAVGKIKLIIHVVSWGYHSFSGDFSYSQHPLYQQDKSLEEFIQVYQKDRLDRELQVLEKIKPYLSVAQQNKIAMITLVTKQDLWWNKRYEAREYYTNGNYNSIIQELQNKKGQDKGASQICKNIPKRKFH